MRAGAACRLESLLESYYGMEDDETAARNSHDIDSNGFVVAEKASEVLASHSLPELMAYNRTLMSEVRGLDEQMQVRGQQRHTAGRQRAHARAWPTRASPLPRVPRAMCAHYPPTRGHCRASCTTTTTSLLPRRTLFVTCATT